MALQAIVLGAGAGGGLPQWNCGCNNCRGARAGNIPPMTQSALAVSANGQDWLLINASPDVRAQLAATPELAPQTLRDSPFKAVLLTDGDLDHIAGLLTLRERSAFSIYGTAEIQQILAENPVFQVLRSELVERRTLSLGETFDMAGLAIEIFPVPGKVALYREGDQVVTDEIGQSVIGVAIRAGGKSLLYIPSCAALPDDLIARIEQADALLFDGTVWENEEMPTLGVGTKSGARMGHLAIAGANGSLATLQAVATQKIFVHINNTNPILQPGSEARATVEAAGWALGFDGMRINL